MDTPYPYPQPVVVRRKMGRRLFLGMVGAGAAGIVLGKNLLPQNLFSPVRNLVSDFSGVNGFEIYTVAPIPVFQRATWRFTVDGLVENPLSLSFDEMMNLPITRQVHDYHCVTGWFIKNIHWTGIPLSVLMQKARPKSTATAVNFYSSDGVYTESLLLNNNEALAPDCYLGFEMNGQPLPVEQGHPFRVVMPRMFGYKGTKWVNRIEVVTQPTMGYWEVRGYDTEAWITT